MADDDSIVPKEQQAGEHTRDAQGRQAGPSVGSSGVNIQGSEGNPTKDDDQDDDDDDDDDDDVSFSPSVSILKG